LPSAENAAVILTALKDAGVNVVASLPDRSLVQVVEALFQDNEIRHVPLSREEEGVGICAGAYFTGQRCALVMQNGGLLNSCNALATTALQFQIPMLLLVLYSGVRGDTAFPVLGQVTEPVLDALSIPYHQIERIEDAPSVIGGALVQAYNMKRPVAVLLHKRIL
jgi:sulfopyruvate decarboxylase subunit alpha